MMEKAIAVLTVFLILAINASLLGQKRDWCRYNCQSCVTVYKACYKAPLIKGKTKAQRQAIAQQIRESKENCERQYKAACKAARESRK